MLRQTKTVTLPYKKSTPGTHVYETKTKGVVVRSVYVSQEVQPTKVDEIFVTVEWDQQ